MNKTERYFYETGDRRTTKFWILDENGNIVKRTDEQADIESLESVEKTTGAIAALYEDNREIGHGYSVLGAKISGASVVAASAFKQ